MAEYDLNYMLEHCIDVFFRYDGRPMHVLTYGTAIPAVLNDVERNRTLQHIVAVGIDELRNDVAVNIEQVYVTTVQEESVLALGEQARDERLVPDEETIVQMSKTVARLGFYSYDCIEELEDRSGIYRLVAYPEHGMANIEYERLPDFNGIDVIERDEDKDLIIKFRM